MLTTLKSIPNRDIDEHLGLMTGSTVRSKHVGRDLFAGLKSIVGGELKGYTELMEEARREATNRLVAKAHAKGANALLGMRYETSNVTPGAVEIFVYGTAVKLR